jgi:hypothetical protein
MANASLNMELAEIEEDPSSHKFITPANERGSMVICAVSDIFASILQYLFS